MPNLGSLPPFNSSARYTTSPEQDSCRRPDSPDSLSWRRTVRIGKRQSEITTNMIGDPKGSRRNLREAESVPGVHRRSLWLRIIRLCYLRTAAITWREIEQHQHAAILGVSPSQSSSIIAARSRSTRAGEGMALVMTRIPHRRPSSGAAAGERGLGLPTQWPEPASRSIGRKGSPLDRMD